jgi:hypothetical protein
VPLDAAPDYRLFSRVVREPDRLSALTAVEYSRVIDAARDARLLGWLIARSDERGAPPDPPDWLADRLANARAWSREYERALTWEIDRLERAFLDTDLPWILLKGAAYVAAGLAPGRGRRVADIDVLVRESDLARAERVLIDHGWEHKTLDPYDERYYREWMHELPPLVHKERQSVVDVHHAILPRTSRLHPPTERLMERAVVTGSGLRVLCPSHMTLHAAAHLFHDGEIAGALRDLVDLDALLRAFALEPSFWDDLTKEAEALDLTRPAYYTLRYSQRWFGTPVPAEVTSDAARWAPPGATVRLMDALVDRAIAGRGEGSGAAAWALYVRSHWLRMPPLQLARHLTRKALSRP